MTDGLHELFDQYVDQLISGEKSAVCVLHDLDLSEVLGPLLETSTLVVQQLGAVEPSPEFRQASRTWVRSLFFSRLARKESRPGFLFMWWQRRWTTAMATALVVCLAGMGLVAASVDSLPNGFFYPMKTATEQVRLMLVVSDVDRAQLQLEFVESRLDEMTTMASRGDSDTVVLLAGEVTHLIAQMCTGALFESLDIDSEIAEVLAARSAADPEMSLEEALSMDRAGALQLLQCAMATAPPELRPTIERLMGALSRDFDASISLIESSA
ncbi:MAG: hypothetical protein IMY84_03240 [Chloroflexi bacterium]|nr:hypothetical protein [Chloroflexota bacterium]